MSGRFVRASKYRHVYGQPTKKELCYENAHVSKNAWDANLIKVNPSYLSVNWDSSGGGALAVIPLAERGKIPDVIPLFRGHTATVLDTDWNPFDDRVLASASEDGKVGIWKVPEGFALKGDSEAAHDVAPMAKLSGHARKVGHVLFHPVASNVLASSSADYTVKFWDIEAGKPQATLKHKDMVLSMAFNYTGSLIVTTSRDKVIRIWDARSEKVVVEGPGHAGSKSQRVVWLGEEDRIATTGFSRMSDRQVAVWDTTDIKKGPIGDFYQLDSSAGINMPFYDVGTKCLYLAGKGDGNIRYYEYENDELFALSEYKSADPQRGIAFMPKRGVSVHENEVVRAYKTVYDSLIEPIQFFVPRRAETFQADIYPDCPSGEAALTAAEWFAGKDSAPSLISLEAIYDGVAPTPTIGEIPTPTVVRAAEPAPAPAPAAATPAPAPTPAPAATYKAPEKDVTKMFATPKVEEMLKKGDEPEEQESEWEPEPVKPAVVEKSVTPVPIVAMSEPTLASTPTPAPAVEVAPAVDPAPATKPTGPAGIIANKIEALHTHVAETKAALDQYEDKLAEVIFSNAKELAARDTRISALEAEVEKLKELVLGTAEKEVVANGSAEEAKDE
ncbi:uncharacterized protein V1518DRAFT_414284 [Limtongia smithiae]|uniref:uncharacterized protein n=1 Tax=Limtongia smithiae TaxID=1125753 RepID=UPI0034CDA503